MWEKRLVSGERRAEAAEGRSEEAALGVEGKLALEPGGGEVDS
jgi:hypothetical protein